ncbi:RNA polymerase sigma factor [Mesobacillus persicus]|uniref:RNA polymerase sigma factor n=1 Tax=Mesobacillus persicus TaxID=930146 RepID=UPI001FCD0842|nr:sigma-70 family RNA polymerase sigma factor [Mesobacillus persicus]
MSWLGACGPVNAERRISSSGTDEYIRDYLLRTAILLIKDEQGAEEAVQDTFISGYDKINQLTDHVKLKSWLTSILINRCRSHMRKPSWKRMVPRFDLIERYEADESTLDPEDHLIQLLESQELAEAIHQLDYKYREAITLFYFNDMKITEMALYLKANESTIKSRLLRGRSKLKEILLRGEDDETGERSNKKTAQ